MLVYTFDRTFDGLLSAIFDAYALHQEPEGLVGKGEVLPLFCEAVHEVVTSEEKVSRVWTGLGKRLSREAMKMLMVSYLSEEKELAFPLFSYIYKVFKHPLPEGASMSYERNFSDPDVLYVTNTARRVMHERLRMMQFLRFQKAKDGTYVGVVSPDNNVLPLIIDHFRDRFCSQPWLIFDARRRYGYYYSPKGEGEGSDEVIRVTFEDEADLSFDLGTGKLNEDLLSSDDHLLQDLWRTYFKAICIRERINPKKQLNDMPRRYWKYMTEKQ
ncbi:MAG: TIGR03915 family putative DNA repair protein [Prevotella sp.]|nr:TIGR03915 family putative DNA repair protein [Prevotella sp.]